MSDEIAQNAQWVKPLDQNKIPQGTTPRWNAESEEWEFVPFTPDEFTPTEEDLAMEAIMYCRATRNVLLQASDWVFAPDSPVPEQDRAEWVAYRKRLRELPKTASDWGNRDMVFPKPPQYPKPE